MQSVVDINAYLARHPCLLPPLVTCFHRGSSISVGKVPRQEDVLLSSIDPARASPGPLPTSAPGAIVEWFEKLGAAVLFSIIVQTSALDEARYQVVDGSHRLRASSWTRAGFRVAARDHRRTADRASPKGGEAQQATPQIRQHLKEDYIDVAVYNTLDPRPCSSCNIGSTCLPRRARASLQVCRLPSIDYHHPTPALIRPPKRYIREDPDFATHLEPALKELHFPKAKTPRQACEDSGVLLLEMLCAPPSSRLSDSRQPRTCGASLRDAEMNRWLARAMLEGSFSGSEATLLQRPISRSPFGRPSRPSCCSRPTMQLRWPPETTPCPQPAPPTRPPGRSQVPSRPDRDLAFMNCLNVRPFPFRKGKVRLPAFSEELGELGCPFERLNETDVGNMPQEITFMDGWRLSEFELVLGYWLGGAAQLPPAMQDYLMPEHCPYARLWEEMGHHDIPVPASAC
ncbi:hypothetical protein PAPYR_9695 [Paratrimastix pyriformis]|uniref:ParB/Sulfiredoxin domain-containing protein n=1 Tax=Paratrimastix pyriformis TaxID=342808 RepID=A0ABQ8UBD5_9EUKA|nr:hypothetical protein PAPYR_9695 [Paratrimastix pyriformis]